MTQNSQPAVSIWLDIAEFFKDYIWFPLSNIKAVHIIDILVLSFLLHIVLRFIRDRHAGRTVIGLILLFVLYAISDIIGMIAINSLLQDLYTVGIIALVVLFQPELRDFFEEFGATTSMNLKRITQRHTTDDEKTLAMVEEICAAAQELSSKKEGALIVIERTGRLRNQMSEGTPIDAMVSRQLLCNIFVNKSPLHDGAVVIRDGRIVKASSKSKTIAEVIPGFDGLGTRHRAAYKICEISDAVVVVVSEENGQISVANNKLLKRGYQDIDGVEKNNNLRDDLFKMMTGKSIADLEVSPDKFLKHNRKNKSKTQDDRLKKGGE